ncbi:hypothetical protein ARMSODRAFT_983701 [Armillaria solidipes]|uniref:Uncharacterized protein n=1 Tax=Armillaria solidipes TaxID=1076256 RepID=A0A2H3B6F1_9AGAR|nr:hypothetical protein ARMSODRAFT_983701 [Armillaria solidipes]
MSEGYQAAAVKRQTYDYDTTLRFQVMMNTAIPSKSHRVEVTSYSPNGPISMHGSAMPVPEEIDVNQKICPLHGVYAALGFSQGWDGWILKMHQREKEHWPEVQLGYQEIETEQTTGEGIACTDDGMRNDRKHYRHTRGLGDSGRVFDYKKPLFWWAVPFDKSRMLT